MHALPHAHAYTAHSHVSVTGDIILPSPQGCGQVTPPNLPAQGGKRRSRLGSGWHVTPRELLSTAAGFSLAAAEEVQTGSGSEQPPPTASTATTKRQVCTSSGASSSAGCTNNSSMHGGYGSGEEEENEGEASAWVTLCMPCTPRCDATLAPNPFAYDAPVPSPSSCSQRASKVSIRSGKGGQPVAQAILVQPKLCSSPAAARTPPPTPAPRRLGAAFDAALLGCPCVHAPRPALAC
ncbi:hypothetical protein DUNSADRAFT_4542 [Dunaliella salina]|uniref:Encoded protein n=1 Tax=Dunaliella salina TaxID=3046 RepID=A0ABQ7GRX7_DUNSA|nr:hypothetical protein DUNSADRAFT_4542 [Dunaliella salina]|eukprot:KAF5837334.1 hypothetical protein DUNSADRAFT_4542 [Dunaliella salina]